MRTDILLIDDDQTSADILAAMLAPIAGTRTAIDAREGIRQVRAAVPDLILLDAEMPGVDGFELCRMLKNETAFRQVPIMFVTAHEEPEFEVRALEAGACDFIRKPVNPAVLRARIATQLEVKRLSAELHQLAMSDGMTGLANRRRFDDVLEIEWSRAQRSREPLSLLMIDIDHFKLYNDFYGHPAGDECLVQVSGVLARSVHRASDLVARLGGEEFAVLLPATDEAGARRVAQGILAAVRDLGMPHAAPGAHESVSVSIGISSRDWQGEDADPSTRRGLAADSARIRYPDLVATADEALYEAKRAGRARMRHQPCRAHPLTRTAEVAQLRPVATEGGRMAGGSPSDAEGWPQFPGFDHDRARHCLSGDPVLFRNLVKRLVDQFGSLGDGERSDHDLLPAQLHKLKGSAGALGATDLQSLAQQAEAALKVGQRALAGRLVAQVRRQLAALAAEPALAAA